MPSHETVASQFGDNESDSSLADFVMLCSFLSLCGCYPCNVVVGPKHADGRWHVHVHKESLTLCVMASNAVDGHLEVHVDVLASSVL